MKSPDQGRWRKTCEETKIEHEEASSSSATIRRPFHAKCTIAFRFFSSLSILAYHEIRLRAQTTISESRINRNRVDAKKFPA